MATKTLPPTSINLPSTTLTAAPSSSTSAMRAIQYHGKESISLTHIPRPALPPGHIRIAPAFCGICGTDLHEYTGGPNFAPTHTHAHPLTNETLPVGFGHEFSGTILEVSPPAPSTSSTPLSPSAPPLPAFSASAYPIGAACTVQPSITCGRCSACTTGASNACVDIGFIGLAGGGGGMAEEVVVPADQVFVLPDSVPLDVGALVEPLSVGWHAVEASGVLECGVTPDRAAVLVLGAGPIGLAVVQCLRAAGVGLIVVSEVPGRRAEFAAQMGAHRVLDPRNLDVVKVVKEELCRERGGVDVCFDCAGFQATIRTACWAIRSRGTVVNLAIWENETGFNPTWLVKKEGRFIGCLGYQAKDYRAVIKALDEGRIDGKSMITGRIKMDELVDKGFKALLTEKDKHVKIIVDVNA